MIVGNEFVYIHVPKTAGTSFELMMRERHELHVKGDQHDSAADIHLWNRSKFIFGFMRDPIKSEVSNWRYHKSSWAHNDQFTFENWCIWRYEEEKEWGTRLGLRDEPLNYGHIFNIRPQAGYFCDENGDCIADMIYRYESLPLALADLTSRLNMDMSIDGFNGMTYGWSRGNEDYEKHVTDRSVEILRKAKGIDFDLHYHHGPISTDFKCEVSANYGYTR